MRNLKQIQFNYNPTPIAVGKLRKLFSHFKHIKFGKSYITIMETICFNGGQILATDFETSILLKCAFFTGSGCIGSKTILDTIKNCSKDDLLFIVFKDDRAEIYVNDKLFISVGIEPVNDFPLLCPYLFDNQFFITSANVDFTPLSSSIGKDDTRVAMKHIKFGKGYAVSTDAQVLKWIPTEYKGDDLLLPTFYSKLSGNFDFYISQYSMEVEEIISVPIERDYEEEEETEFIDKIQKKTIQGNYLISDFNNECVIITKVCESNYPDWTAVVPTDNPYSIVVETSILKDAIKKVSICSNKYKEQVIFTIKGLILNVSAFDEDRNVSASVDIPLFHNSESEPKQIGFNWKYILSNMDDRKTTEITYSTPNRATIWNKNMLIMPIGISEETKKENRDLQHTEIEEVIGSH